MTILYVALGGAVGAVVRFGLGSWIQDRAGPGFPWGTFVVNLLGSLLIGIAIRSLDAADPNPELRALLTVGLLGGFTTFSTFSYEVVTLLQKDEWARATLYAGGSLGLGILAVIAGVGLAGSFLPPR